MSKKIFPKYRLLLQEKPTELNNNGIITYAPSEKYREITYPITIEFDIERNTSATLNSASFAIYNLSAKTHNDINKDRYLENDLGNGKEKRKVLFYAGYAGQYTLAFSGDLLEAYTERKGVDIITHLFCQDGAYEAYNQFTTQTFENSQIKDILKTLFVDLKIPTGKIGEVNVNQPLRGVVMNGNTYSLLCKNFNNLIFIDEGKINYLNESECLEAVVPLINGDTGLRGVPRRQGSVIELETLFEPRIIVGQVIEVQSQIDKRFDGQFKVIGIKHNGTISGAVDGDRVTKLTLLLGNQLAGGLSVVK